MQTLPVLLNPLISFIENFGLIHEICKKMTQVQLIYQKFDLGLFQQSVRPFNPYSSLPLNLFPCNLQQKLETTHDARSHEYLVEHLLYLQY